MEVRNQMKNILLMAALGLVVASPVLAQEGGRRGQGGQGGQGGQRRQGGGQERGGQERGGGARRNPLTRLVGQLDLTPDQKGKAEKMLDEYTKKRTALDEEARKNLESMLTDPQKKKLQELMEQSRQRGQGGPGGPGGPGAGRPGRP